MKTFKEFISQSSINEAKIKDKFKTKWLERDFDKFTDHLDDIEFPGTISELGQNFKYLINSPETTKATDLQKVNEMLISDLTKTAKAADKHYGDQAVPMAKKLIDELQLIHKKL